MATKAEKARRGRWPGAERRGDRRIGEAHLRSAVPGGMSAAIGLRHVCDNLWREVVLGWRDTLS